MMSMLPGIQYTACNDNLTPVTPTSPNQPAASLVPQAFSISGTAGTGSLVGTSVSKDFNINFILYPFFIKIILVFH